MWTKTSNHNAQKVEPTREERAILGWRKQQVQNLKAIQKRDLSLLLQGTKYKQRGKITER